MNVEDLRVGDVVINARTGLRTTIKEIVPFDDPFIPGYYVNMDDRTSIFISRSVATSTSQPETRPRPAPAKPGYGFLVLPLLGLWRKPLQLQCREVKSMFSAFLA